MGASRGGPPWSSMQLQAGTPHAPRIMSQRLTLNTALPIKDTFDPPSPLGRSNISRRMDRPGTKLRLAERQMAVCTRLADNQEPA